MPLEKTFSLRNYLFLSTLMEPCFFLFLALERRNTRDYNILQVRFINGFVLNVESKPINTFINNFTIPMNDDYIWTKWKMTILSLIKFTGILFKQKAGRKDFKVLSSGFNFLCDSDLTTSPSWSP